MDPNLDPELALALRVSMEEERARQEAAAKKAAEEAVKQDKREESSSKAEDANMSDHVNASASEKHKLDAIDEVVISLLPLLSLYTCTFFIELHGSSSILLSSSHQLL